MPKFAHLLFAAPIVCAAHLANASASHYGLTISTAATYDVSFNNGMFTATGDQAVLNVNDLENALANGSTKVTTDNGSGGDEKGDLHVEASLSWTTVSALTLDAYHSIFVDKPILDHGAGSLTLTDNEGGQAGQINFGPRGKIRFRNLSSALTINGNAYVLVDDLPTLANDIIANNSAGYYALANDYDASQDGTYASSPISTNFTGSFDGLGNVISNLAITDQHDDGVGLFLTIDTPATVAHFSLDRVNIQTTNVVTTGGLAAGNRGLLFEDSVTGTINSSINASASGSVTGGLTGANVGGVIDGSSTDVVIAASMSYGGTIGLAAGGLVGENTSYGSVVGSIANSHSSGSVATVFTQHHQPTWAAGLVGRLFQGSITTSFATGDINCTPACKGGGLVGEVGHHNGAGGYSGSVSNSYATGSVVAQGDSSSFIGGLVGSMIFGSIDASYATGAMSAKSKSVVGGLIGRDQSSAGSLTNCYWDTDTSGITNLSQGAGSPPNDQGITGLTTAQLQSGLPTGFDPAVWAEKAKINSGLPYLKNNAPQK